MSEGSILTQLREGRSVTFFTVGVSMRPLLKERETHVVIKPLKTAKVGDILLYVRPNGKRVLHRLIRIHEDFYEMRGDNTYSLERIGKDQAVGIAVTIWRNGRYIDVETNRNYKRYVKFWQAIYPLRYVLWRLRRICGSVLRRIRKM